MPSIGRQKFIKFEAYTLKKTFRFATAKMREIVDCLYNRRRTESELVQLCTWLNDCYDPKRPFTIVSLCQCIRKALHKSTVYMHAEAYGNKVYHWRPEVEFEHPQLSPRHKMILYQYLVGLKAQDITVMRLIRMVFFFQVFIILLGIQCERILLWKIL